LSAPEGKVNPGTADGAPALPLGGVSVSPALLVSHPSDLPNETRWGRLRARSLELAAEKGGWGKPLPKARGRGMAAYDVVRKLLCGSGGSDGQG
jgi:hypothetical protein